jgi:hypothetical protein
MERGFESIGVSNFLEVAVKIFAMRNAVVFSLFVVVLAGVFAFGADAGRGTNVFFITAYFTMMTHHGPGHSGRIPELPGLSR